MDELDPEEREKAPGRPCARIVLGLFGGLFLIALLSVPVTTRTSRLRQDPASLVVFKTTYPRNERLFLPTYLSRRADPVKGREVRLRTAQWWGTMGIIAVLGLVDFVVICRLLRRPGRPVPPRGGTDLP